MALSRIAAGAGAGATIALAAHQAGDIIVIYAFRDGSTTAPTLPAGWLAINSGGANTCSGRLGYKIAKNASTTSGTWTNATHIAYTIYRGQHPKSPIGGNAGTNGTAASVSYPALTMVDTGGTSVVLGFCGHRSVDTTLETAPTGMTNRSTHVDATDEIAGHDTGTVSSWSLQTVAVGGTASGWRGVTVELRNDPGGVADNEFWVATDGDAGNAGTEGSPWTVQHVATGAGGLLLPGDTVRFKAGTYDVTALVFTVNGFPNNPIIFRAADGVRAHIRGVSASFAVDDIIIDGANLWFWRLEFSRDWPVGERANSHTAGAAVYNRNSPDGTKLIHCVIHDGDDGLFNDANTGDVEVYGCVSYNNGNDTAPKGHNFYCQHDDAGGTAGELMVEDNISFNSFGFALQSYASSGSGDQTGIRIRRNIMFNAGVLSTSQTTDTMNIGSDVAADPTVRCDVLDNVMVNIAGRGRDHLVCGHSGDPIDGLDVERNYFINGGEGTGFATVFLEGAPNVAIGGAFTCRENIIHVSPTGARRVVRFNPADANLAGVDWDLNNIFRDPTATAWQHAGGTSKNFADWKTATGKGTNDTATADDPTQVSLFYFPTDRYEEKRGHVAYLNWPDDPSIPVDLSQLGFIAGDMYEVRDCRDVYGSAILSGTYNGGNVAFPVTQVSDPAVVGTAPGDPPDTAPFFNAFVVEFTGVDEGGGGGPGSGTAHTKQRKVTAALKRLGRAA